MESSFYKRALVIGDSRVEGYSQSLKDIVDVVEICQFSELKHEEIILHAENYLNLHHPDIIIILTLTNDLIEKTAWDSKMRSLYHKRVTFNSQLALENIEYYTNRWSVMFPKLSIIWTIPDVPNLIDYNMSCKDLMKVSTLHISEKKIISQNEKDIYESLSYLRINCKEKLKPFSNTYVLELREFTATEIQEKTSATLHTKYDDIRVYHNSKLYKDGIHPVTEPKPVLADIFTDKIKSCIESFTLSSSSKEVDTITTASCPPQPPSPPANESYNDLTKSILQRLKDRHEMEWFSYRNNPQSHPNYESEKHNFMESKAKEMAFKGVYPSADEISAEWSAFWKNRLEALYDEVWKIKKKDCLELLPSSSILPSVSPARSTYNDRSRHASSSYENSSHHGDRKYYVNESRPKTYDYDHKPQNKRRLDDYSQDDSSMQFSESSYRKSFKKRVTSESELDSLNDCNFSMDKNLETVLKVYDYPEEISRELKQLQCDILDLKMSGSKESNAFNRRTLHFLQEAKCILEKVSDKKCDYNVKSTLLNNSIMAINNLIDYNDLVTCYSNANAPKKRESQDRFTNLQHKSFGKYTAEELIYKFERYYSLHASEKYELSSILEKLERNENPLAATLNILKKQS